MSTKTTKLGLPLIPEAEYDTKKVIDMIKENQGTASDSAFNKIDSFASNIDTRVNGKQEKLVSGQNIKTINGKSVLGTGDIEITVPNVPVEDVTVNGDSVVANKIARITVPTKVSDLTNDSKFITNSVDNLVNYYNKADVYTKTEIDNTLATFSKLKLTVVDSLPTTGEPDTIYLVPADSKTEHDYYNEYIWLSNKWELLGNTKIALSDYYKKSEVDSKFATKTDVQAVDAKIPSLDGYATETYVNNHHDNTKVDKTDFKFKTINNQEITGEGNISITVPDVPVEDVTVDGVSIVDNKTAKISLSGKQDKLVSGTNIKTINNQSILGSGNITIEAAEQVQADWNETDESSKAYIKNKPTVPSGQIQADWNQTDTAATDFIKNKPEIPEAVSVSKTGSSTEEVQYITIGENEYKLAGGGSGGLPDTSTAKNNDVLTVVKECGGTALDRNTAYSKFYFNFDTKFEDIKQMLTDAGCDLTNYDQWITLYVGSKIEEGPEEGAYYPFIDLEWFLLSEDPNSLAFEMLCQVDENTKLDFLISGCTYEDIQKDVWYHDDEDLSPVSGVYEVTVPEEYVPEPDRAEEEWLEEIGRKNECFKNLVSSTTFESKETVVWKEPQFVGKEISFEHKGDTYKVNSYLNAGGLGVESVSSEENKACSAAVDDLGLHISETVDTSDETAIQTELAISKDAIYYARNGIDEQGQEVHTNVKKSIEDLLTGSAIPEEWKEFIEASMAESSMTEFGECDTMTLDFTEDDTRKLGLLLAYLDIEED